MILQRIKRGANKSHLLLRNQLVQLTRSLGISLPRPTRNVGLTLLAAYTATIPLHVFSQGIAFAQDSSTEPPSMQSTLSGSSLSVETFNAVNSTAVTDSQVPTPVLPDMVITTSRVDIIQQEQERLRQLQEGELAEQKKEQEAQAAALEQQRLAAYQQALQQAAQAKAAAQAQTIAASNNAPQQSLSDIQSQAQDLVLASFGNDEAQWGAFYRILQQESGWNVHAYNASSGAYGIPQALPGSKMASAGPDWHDNPVTQVRWAIGYMHDRYGTPLIAEGFKRSHGWY